MPLLEIIEVAALAVVQGVTEFLPISSSGHLVVGAALLEQFGRPVQDKLTVNIALHVGTLAAIIVFYWRRILALLGEDRRVVGLIVVGSIPAAVIGISLKLTATPLLESPVTAGFMFPLTGALLIWSARHQTGQSSCRDLHYRQALIIGLFQAFAILPGISRSGATIVAGLSVGLKRSEAAAFSFLLAIPAIGGAGLIESLELLKQSPEGTPLVALGIGVLVSFLVGWASLAWLVNWLQEGRLYRFAWWVLLLGPVVLAWQFLGS